MRDKPWFVPKQYGYGANPSSWEGWAVVLGFVLATMLIVWLGALVPVQAGEPISVARVLAAGVGELLLVAALIAICRHKTEGKWRWRWGDR